MPGPHAHAEERDRLLAALKDVWERGCVGRAPDPDGGRPRPRAEVERDLIGRLRLLCYAAAREPVLAKPPKRAPRKEQPDASAPSPQGDPE